MGIQVLVQQLFKDEKGDPIFLTVGQALIFWLIYNKIWPRNHLMTCTRYGKSHTVGMAVLLRIATFPEKWAVVSGKQDQASIIMKYIIQHAFDSPFFLQKLIIQPGETLERLRRERSKNALTFKHSNGTYGEIFIASADSKNRQSNGDAVMGFGAANVVLDEASLISDDIEAKIFRMLADQTDNFYLKIGNPFNRNHFLKSYEDKNYLMVDIDYNIALMEGRLIPDFVDEARKKPFFSILWENKFPPADTMDNSGYVPLIANTDLRILPKQAFHGFIGNRKLGVDPSGEGSDETVWVIRDQFYSEVVAREKISDETSIAAKTITLMRYYNVKAHNVYVDSFGIGSKTVHKLATLGVIVNAVNVGDSFDAKDLRSDMFLNLRAFMYWSLREWLMKGGQVIEGGDWNQLLQIKFKSDNSRRIKIMPKDQMRKNGVDSPNHADALMVTFYEIDLPFEESTDTVDVEYFDEFDSTSII